MRRADAQRSYDRLLAAASEVVAEQGADVSLEEVARRAGVGSATLHRHFRGRGALLDAVFRERVVALCTLASSLAGELPAGEALVEWLRAVVRHAVAHQGLAGALSAPDAHALILAAGERLVCAAQDAGAVRRDVLVDDLLVLLGAVAREGARAERLLELVVRGVVG